MFICLNASKAALTDYSINATLAGSHISKEDSVNTHKLSVAQIEALLLLKFRLEDSFARHTLSLIEGPASGVIENRRDIPLEWATPLLARRLYEGNESTWLITTEEMELELDTARCAQIARLTGELADDEKGKFLKEFLSDSTSAWIKQVSNELTAPGGYSVYWTWVNAIWDFLNECGLAPEAVAISPEAYYQVAKRIISKEELITKVEASVRSIFASERFVQTVLTSTLQTTARMFGGQLPPDLEKEMRDEMLPGLREHINASIPQYIEPILTAFRAEVDMLWTEPASACVQ